MNAVIIDHSYKSKHWKCIIRMFRIFQNFSIRTFRKIIRIIIKIKILHKRTQKQPTFSFDVFITLKQQQMAVIKLFSASYTGYIHICVHTIIGQLQKHDDVTFLEN